MVIIRESYSAVDYPKVKCKCETKTRDEKAGRNDGLEKRKSWRKDVAGIEPMEWRVKREGEKKGKSDQWSTTALFVNSVRDPLLSPKSNISKQCQSSRTETFVNFLFVNSVWGSTSSPELNICEQKPQLNKSVLSIRNAFLYCIVEMSENCKAGRDETMKDVFVFVFVRTFCSLFLYLNYKFRAIFFPTFLPS